MDEGSNDPPSRGVRTLLAGVRTRWSRRSVVTRRAVLIAVVGLLAALGVVAFLGSSSSAAPFGSIYVTNSQGPVSVLHGLYPGVSTPPPSSFPPGVDPAGAVVSPDGNLLYVAGVDGSTVRVFSTNNNLLTAVFTTGQKPNWLALSPDGKVLAVSNSGDHTVSLLDANTGTRLVPDVPLTGNDARQIAITQTPSGGHYTWFLADDHGGLNYGTLIDSVQWVASAPQVLANELATGVATSGDVVYVAALVPGQNGRLDMMNVQSIGTVRYSAASSVLLDSASQVSVSGDGGHAYLAGQGGLSAFDFTRGAPSTSNFAISHGVWGPYGSVVSPNGKYVYTANTDQSVSVVDTGNPANELTVTDQSFTGPVQIAYDDQTTQTSVVSSNPTAVVGQSVTLTATVASASPPSGTVKFVLDPTTEVASDSGTLLGTATVNGSGTASLTTSVPFGGHTVTAYYLGDSVSTMSRGSTPQTMLGTTTTQLSSTPDPQTYGGAVAFTAHVTNDQGGAQMTGDVAFSDGGTVLATVNVTGGTAQYTTSALSAGSHTITATYGNDPQFAPSTGSLTQDIQSPTTLTLTYTPTELTTHQAASLEAVVTAAQGTAGVPTGTVDFVANGTPVGTATLDSSGKATSANFPVGTNGVQTFTATYHGDPTHLGTTASVNPTAKTATTVQLNVQPGSVNAGQQVTLSATVSPTPPGGTVTFNDGGTVLGTVATNGSASFQTSSLTVGSHTLTASYSGDNSDYPSASKSVTLTVNKATSVTALTTSPSTWLPGQPATLTATVTDRDLNSSAPPATGSITFKDNATTLGSVPVGPGGQASLTVPSFAVGSHNVSAVYSGDDVYNSSTSSGITQTVAKQASATSLTSSPSTWTPWQSITFTATVTNAGKVSTAPTPSGTITFKDGSTVLGNAPLESTGQAVLAVPAFGTGPHTVTAVYSGDTVYNSSTSPGITQTVAKEASATSLTSSPSTWTPWQSITFTATVTNADAGSTAPTPTGTVTFKDGASTLGSAPVGSGGQASLTVPPLSIGSHSITAVYNGDGAHSSSTSPALTQTSNKATTTTAVSSSANPAAVGQRVTFTMTVTSSADTSQAPSGTVTLSSDTDTLTNAALSPNPDGTSTATFTTATLTAGSHSLTANYPGDATHSASTSTPLNQNVRAGATTALTSDANPSATGQQVTFTAKVTGSLAATPGGTVTFADSTNGGAPVTLATQPLTNGTATLSTATLSAGAHTITATYSGDDLYQPGSSNSLTQTVAIANTTTTLTISPTTLTAGQPTALTAHVTGNVAATPAGTVAFTEGATTLGSGPVTLTNGTATLTLTTLSAGTHSITATYDGQAPYTGSSSAPQSVTVNAATPAITLISSQNPSTTHANVTLTATVAGPDPSSPTPTGTVTFTDTTDTTSPVTLATQPLTSGSATLTTSALSAGTHTITATYNGDQLYTSGTSAPLSQAVGEATSATSLAAAPAQSTAGQQVAFTATVTGPSSASPTPTGSVVFSDGTQPLGTAVTLDSNGTATLKTAALNAGAHTITAVFTGTGTYAASTSSATATEIVAQPLIITTTSLPDATDGSAYNATLAADGGATPYKWSVSSGTLPNGLTLDPATGAITGTPTAADPATFTVTVTDANGQSATRNLSLTPAAAGSSQSASPTPSAGTSTSPSTAATTGTTSSPASAPAAGSSDNPTSSASPSSQATSSAPGSPSSSAGSSGPLAHTGTAAVTTAVLAAVLLLGGTLLYRRFHR